MCHTSISHTVEKKMTIIRDLLRELNDAKSNGKYTVSLTDGRDNNGDQMKAYSVLLHVGLPYPKLIAECDTLEELVDSLKRILWEE